MLGMSASKAIKGTSSGPSTLLWGIYHQGVGGAVPVGGRARRVLPGRPAQARGRHRRAAAHALHRCAACSLCPSLISCFQCQGALMHCLAQTLVRLCWRPICRTVQRWPDVGWLSAQHLRIDVAADCGFQSASLGRQHCVVNSLKLKAGKHQAAAAGLSVMPAVQRSNAERICLVQACRACLTGYTQAPWPR